MTPTEQPVPTWLKRTLAVGGWFLALPGLPALVGYLCLLPLTLGSAGSPGLGLLLFVTLLVTVGAGGAVAWHGGQSLEGKPSTRLRLPSVGLMAGAFGLAAVAAVLVYELQVAAGFLFPPLLVAMAALPPLLAVSWFAGPSSEGLTWRRGLVAFAGGATASVGLAVLLEVLFPAVILLLLLYRGQAVLERAEAALAALAGGDIADAITDPGFLYIMIQLAVVAPVAEELVKPLVTLPLLRRLGRRDAFLLAALAGAGFAALENVLYAGFGTYLWAGILLVRSLGGAIHPLGAGLTGLAWRGILRGERGAWQRGAVGLGLAVGVHALWNGGCVLVVTLAGAGFFGQLPPGVDLLGLSAAGTTLAFLIVLGLAALWLGRAVARGTEAQAPAGEPGLVLSDRAVALWALACLAAIVPAGITGLRLLVR